MIRPLLTRRPCSARPRKVRQTRPLVEGLEDRRLLSSTNGGHWVHPNRITYSFMPDGTSVGGVPSSLFRTMNADYPSTTAWEQAFEQAAAVWQEVTNINLALVSDNGEPVGSQGDQQGDPNIGDIRIGAVPEPNGALGLAIDPPPVNGGTDAGDMLFNSSVTWGSSGYDLESVALHEFGHALGLGESAVQQAVMYTYYTGVKTTLSTDDTSAIQSLYGAVPAPPANNHTFSTATNITPAINGNGQIALANEYITGSSDADFYVVTVPSNTTGTMTVSMQSSNLSSLCPRITLFNGSESGLGQTLLANSFGATATYTVSNVQPGQVYYIRASAANTGRGSNGAYGLLVNFGSKPQAAIAPPNTVVASQPDQGGGSGYEQTAGSGSSTSLGLGLSLGGGSLLLVNLSLSTPILSTDVSVAFGGSNLLDVGVKIQIGTLSAWGDYLTASPSPTPGAHPLHQVSKTAAPKVPLGHSSHLVHTPPVHTPHHPRPRPRR